MQAYQYAYLKFGIIVLVTTFLLGLTLNSVAQSVSTQRFGLSGHIIVIDAGSTGTRAHLFSYERPSLDSNEIASIKVIKEVKTKPGVSSYADKLNQLDNYFDKLFKPIAAKLTAEQRRNTSVFLFATAGVRLLEPSQRSAIVNMLRKVINTQIYSLGFQKPIKIKQDVRVITGADEALFSWVTVNYLMQRLTNKALEEHKTFGVLDIGGTSAEITFQPKSIPVEHFKDFYYNGKNHLIYSHSNDYGFNKALEMMRKHYGKKLEVCFPEGKGNFNACTDLLFQTLFNPEIK